MTLDEIALGLRLLSRLTGSAMSMGQVIELFPDVAPHAWRRPALELRSAILQGHPFSRALVQSVPGFPPQLAAIVRAGEGGLALPSAIARASSEAERISAARKALREALAYPVFLVVCAIVTIGVLLLVVLPRFVALLGDVQKELPPAAQALVTLSSVAAPLLLTVAALVAGSAACLRVVRRQADGRAALDRMWLTLPVTGPLASDASVVSIASSLAALLSTGVHVAEAVQLCLGITNNAHTDRSLVRARRDILHGSSLSQALSANRLLTAAHAGVVRSGEEVGSVPQALEHVASLARDQMDARLRKTLRTIEPATILVVGMLIACVAGILMQTIYTVQP